MPDYMNRYDSVQKYEHSVTLINFNKLEVNSFRETFGTVAIIGFGVE